MNSETVINQIKEQNIQWIQVHFTDLSGNMRIVHIPADTFIKDSIIEHGCGVDGSSMGLRSVENSDLLIVPDPDTFRILPFENNEARLIADIYNISYEPFSIDPRSLLKKTMRYITNQGFDTVHISPEMEFFVLSTNLENEYSSQANCGYFCAPPMDDAKNFRKEISDILWKSGFNIKYHHHENGRYQHEIEVKSMPAVAAADFSVYFKHLTKLLSASYEVKVSFMPKLFEDEAGNGMHAHLKLINDGSNIFYDNTKPHSLSDTAQHFIGGILHHAKSIAAFANSTMNSYKRLIPHYEAPVYIAWGEHNRSSLIRIAAKRNIDIEIRNADPAANPYLFFSALIYAGLDGIENEIVYKPVEKNIYEMSDEEIKKEEIEKLPENLFESLTALEQDQALKKMMGIDLVKTYVKIKKQECQNYLREISDVDIEFYFNV